ncbi:SDR family NAD(P)-dependent oxidoreductase [Pleomorphomonas sp. PLEO]|uniref:SDR family NAD(P)-dependent oxidoreductase n=1 Tax=Pleomorphomonas sp. PLEO TaxID=3239306 RepID=UPI00351F406E
MPTVLITGANRGIGLEFARQYAADGWHVVMLNRTLLASAARDMLGPQATEFFYDALDDASAAEAVRSLSGTPVDVAILNAGLGAGPDLPPEAIRRDHWEATMLTNAYAPLHLAALLEPNLRAGSHKVLASVSSLAASMADYDVPRQFVYRASKAALNQLWRNLSVEWRPWGCICLALRPGRVSTRMTNFSGELTPAQSVVGLRQVINDATAAESGCHIGYDGRVVPW